MADNSASIVELRAHQQKLLALVDINEDVSQEVADRFDARIERNIAEQRDPYGHLWHPSKLGGAVLTKAKQAIRTIVKGSTITHEVSGVEAMHHVGAARGYHGGSGKLGGFRRALIPFSKLPGAWNDDIREVLQKRFDAIFGKRAA